MWFGNNDRPSYSDDYSYPCGSTMSSSFPTPNFTSSVPQNNPVTSNSSSCNNEHSCFLLDDADTANLPTRKNSLNSFRNLSDNDVLFGCSPAKDDVSLKGWSNDLSGLKQKLQSLETLQHHQSLHLQHQMKIDAELAASQAAKEQEEKRQEMIKLIE